MAQVKKVKVELRRSKMQTATSGYEFHQRTWDIPVSKAEGEKAIPLEEEMLAAVYGEFPEQMKEAIGYLIYGELSPGGTQTVGDVTLTVSFYNVTAPDLA